MSIEIREGSTLHASPERAWGFNSPSRTHNDGPHEWGPSFLVSAGAKVLATSANARLRSCADDRVPGAYRKIVVRRDRLTSRIGAVQFV